MLPIRSPIIAGKFYEIEPEKLKKQLDACFRRASKEKKKGRKVKKKKIVGAVVPHAGYEYSGWIAAKFYSRIDKDWPMNYIILGPSHYTFGSKYASMKKGLWKTPLGGVVVHEGMTDSISNECEFLENDFIVHQNEHSIEAQLPFLQYKLGDGIKIVPIAISNETPSDILLDGCRKLGESIAKSIKESDEEWFIIASTDLSHYIPEHEAEKIDSSVLDAIKKMDEKRFFDRIRKKNASVCGFGAVATAIVAAKELGSKKGKLLKYGTSADTTENKNSVVGYASMLI